MAESVPGQGDWSSLGGDVYGILTGGLQGALDLELAKGRARIDQQSIADDTQKFVRGEGDTMVRAGNTSGMQFNPNWILYAGAVVMAVIAYLALRE